MKIAVLGAGAGGTAATVELTQAGHEVSLWARSPATLEPHIALGGIAHEGVLGEGITRPSSITADLGAAIAGAAAAVVVLPTFSHVPIAAALAAADWPEDRLVVLNPGHTGGALEFAEAFRRQSRCPPPVVEFSTLTYVARKYRPDGVTVTGRARHLKAAALGGGGDVVDLAMALFPGVVPVSDVIATDLSNVNMVLHPPCAVLSAAWVEATRGDFTFYVQGMTEGVTRVMRQLDAERLAVARAFGHELPNLIEEMKLIGTVEAGADSTDFRAAIAGGEANSRIKAPDSFGHRYYREDFGHGLLPFLEFARIAGVETPAASALCSLAGIATGLDFYAGGRTARTMGIEGLTRDQLKEKVSGALGRAA